MGAGSGRTQASDVSITHVESVCTSDKADIKADIDPEPEPLGHAVFVSDAQAEHAEIARLIEALARERDEDGAEPETEPSLPLAARCCRPRSEGGKLHETTREELRLPGQKPYAGLSILELTVRDHSSSPSCNANHVLELIESSEELPEPPHRSSTVFSYPFCQNEPHQNGSSQGGSDALNLGCSGCGDEPGSGALQKAWHMVQTVPHRTCCSAGRAETALGNDVQLPSGKPESCFLDNAWVAPQAILSDYNVGCRNCVNGSQCVGQWTGNYLDGYGIERWPDGSVFVGDFRRGQKHGEGRLAWVSGSTYEGEFEEDAIHGEGLYMWSDGRGYSGQWTQNLAGPCGTMRWSDGRTYQGEWNEGYMCGSGKFQSPDGRCVSGRWISGRQHGTGVVRSSQGHERHGLWKDGEFVRWLSAPGDEAAGAPMDIWEVSTSTLRPSTRSPRHTPQSSPRKGLTPRHSSTKSRGGDKEVLCSDPEGAQLIAESCTLGTCQAIGDSYEL